MCALFLCLLSSLCHLTAIILLIFCSNVLMYTFPVSLSCFSGRWRCYLYFSWHSFWDYSLCLIQAGSTTLVIASSSLKQALSHWICWWTLTQLIASTSLTATMTLCAVQEKKRKERWSTSAVKEVNQNKSPPLTLYSTVKCAIAKK